MNCKMLLKRTFEITGYTITKLTPPPAPDAIYDQDGLRTVHNHDFLNDADFIRAYKRGAQAVGQDYL